MADLAPEIPCPETTAAADPLAAYRSALKTRSAAELFAIAEAIGLGEPAARPAALIDAVADYLAEARVVQRLLAYLPLGGRLALSLFALTENHSWPVAGLELSLRCLGFDPAPAIASLVRLGLLALKTEPDRVGPDAARAPAGERGRERNLIAHPAILAATSTALPETAGPPAAGPVHKVREADGLEPILRLAALWQLVATAPLRHTQQGTLYKRDRDRLEDDPVLAGPVADSLEPIPDMASFWLALGRGVGVLVDEPGTDRIVAAPGQYWSENAVGLPQMIATRWLGLRTWHELSGSQDESSSAALALPYVRPAVLLRLARHAEGDWVVLADLVRLVEQTGAGWDRLLLDDAAETGAEAQPKRGRGKGSEPAPASPLALLAGILLGPAYQLGLVRAAEEVASGRKVVQLTALGRYVLALGPPPTPREQLEHCLYVQPNFEVIAYRQGLTAAMIGQLSRFARWTKLGAALEMKLTAESTYQGLEGGMTPESMMDRLARHSGRSLPPSVAEAVCTWAGRRQRVTYHASATLIEFATSEARDAALAEWPANGATPPAAVADRLLLVEDERSIPFHRFRLTSSRDYRRPPETCIEVEPDGITLSLDPARADLFIEAELGRLAEELPWHERGASGSLPRRRFRVTTASIRRAVEAGLNPASLARWFERRAGETLPPASRLILHAAATEAPALRAVRSLVLSAPSVELLDGLLQHPLTRTYLGERLGPTAVVVAESGLGGLREALGRLGVPIVVDHPAGDRDP